MAEDRSSVDVIRESKVLAYTVGAFTLAAGVTLLLSANSGRFLINLKPLSQRRGNATDCWNGCMPSPAPPRNRTTSPCWR